MDGQGKLFLEHLARYGVVRDRTPEGFWFTQNGEQSSRYFRISGVDIQNYLSHEPACPDVSSESFAQLPNWAADEIFTFIGANEEPYDETVVVLTERGFETVRE